VNFLENLKHYSIGELKISWVSLENWKEEQGTEDSGLMSKPATAATAVTLAKAMSQLTARVYVPIERRLRQVPPLRQAMS
jgi:hypothetical protein